MARSKSATRPTAVMVSELSAACSSACKARCFINRCRNTSRRDILGPSVGMSQIEHDSARYERYLEACKPGVWAVHAKDVVCAQGNAGLVTPNQVQRTGLQGELHEQVGGQREGSAALHDPRIRCSPTT